MQFIKNEDIAHYDNEPYVLIDMSGSTNSKCKITSEKQTILQAEVDIACNIMKERNIQKCHIILWSGNVNLNEQINISQLIENKEKYSKVSSGGTYLAPPLNSVLANILDNKIQNKDLYIITDGEIFDTELISKPLADLFTEKINIYVITVENNCNNYYSSNCTAGNNLYNYLNKNSKMNFVKQIIQYNNHHSGGFNALNNFDVPEGHLPFKDNIFLTSDFSSFTQYIKKEILLTNNDNLLLKLAHDLSRTVFYLSKNKETNVRQIIVNNISEYFKNTNIYNEVRNLMLKEIDNHINHKSSTFQDYRSRRNELFERSQLNLMDNTKTAITFNSTDEYISIPMKTNSGIYIFKCHEKFVNGNICFDKLKFNNCGFNYNNYVIPVFPTNIVLNEANDQCLRQWIRANYSQIHDIQIVSGKILCLLLIDMLFVNLSNVSQDTKNNYIKLATVMLNAKTYGTDTTIIEELKNKKNLPTYEYFDEYLNKNNMNLKSGCLWFGILCCLNNAHVLNSQKHIYEKDLNDFLVNNNLLEGDFISHLKNIFNAEFKEISFKQKYTLPYHEVLSSIPCTNTYINESEYNKDNEFCKCPLCGELLRTSSITINLNENSTDIIIENKKYHNSNQEKIKLVLSNDNSLLKINDLDFNTTSYDIQNVILTDILNTSKMIIKTKEKFIEKVASKYPFLENLDMGNVCLAGGFVKSILLGQKMKDFDFFVYGVDNPVARTVKLVNDLVDNIKKTYPDTKNKFLYVYKPMFNVFEIVYFEDPTNHFDSDFTASNFSKYKFDSLRTFDKNNVVNRDKNYFEDGDSKGIKIKHRFQFILCKFNSIQNILETFDITPSCVAFDGHDVYFTNNSYQSYKYMINIVKTNRWTYLYDSRMSKYLSYGFDIAFPENDVPDVETFKSKFEASETFVQLCSLKFDINKIIDNKIIVKHDSHKKELFENLNEIEKNCQLEGKSGLYKSSLYCSLVSLLRYICINDMLYEITDGKLLPDENNVFKFKNGSHQLNFIEKFVVEFNENKWYTDHYYIPPKTLIVLPDTNQKNVADIIADENNNESDDDSEDDSEDDSSDDSGDDSEEEPVKVYKKSSVKIYDNGFEEELDV